MGPGLCHTQATTRQLSGLRAMRAPVGLVRGPPETLPLPVPLTVDQFQGLLLGPGDLLLPPGRRPPRLAVLDQQVRAADPGGLPLPIFAAAATAATGATGPLPLAGVGDMVEVVHAACRGMAGLQLRLAQRPVMKGRLGRGLHAVDTPRSATGLGTQRSGLPALQGRGSRRGFKPPS